MSPVALVVVAFLAQPGTHVCLCVLGLLCLRLSLTFTEVCLSWITVLQGAMATFKVRGERERVGRGEEGGREEGRREEGGEGSGGRKGRGGMDGGEGGEGDIVERGEEGGDRRESREGIGVRVGRGVERREEE